jgi:hypothetical protein
MLRFRARHSPAILMHLHVTAVDRSAAVGPSNMQSVRLPHHMQSSKLGGAASLTRAAAARRSDSNMHA